MPSSTSSTRPTSGSFSSTPWTVRKPRLCSWTRRELAALLTDARQHGAFLAHLAGEYVELAEACGALAGSRLIVVQAGIGLATVLQRRSYPFEDAADFVRCAMQTNPLLRTAVGHFT